MRHLALALWTVLALPLSARAQRPPSFQPVWSDDFTSLSLRSGGPSYAGLEAGSGTWSSPGLWYATDPKGVAGFGHDWFINPDYRSWPAGIAPPFALTKAGLLIRSQKPPPDMAAILPQRHGQTPWLSAIITSYHAVRIQPPFFFEAIARMPVGTGRPWPAIWLVTHAHQRHDSHGKEYEIDVHEGFGDSDRLHAAVHWSPDPDRKGYALTQEAVNQPSRVDLAAGFNTWGCYVTASEQVFSFNGVEVGRVRTPQDADADQPFGILLDVSAGLPWNGGGPPFGGPHEMIVRSVRLYAPDQSGLTLR